MARSSIGLTMLGLGAAACFNPDDPTAASSTDTHQASIPNGTEAAAELPTSGTSSPSPSSTGPEPTTAGEAGGATSSTDPESSSSEGAAPEPGCGDGFVVATEVCYEVAYTLEGNSYRFGFLEDFDGDEDRDLIYSETSGEISVQLNANNIFGLAVTSAFNGVTSLSDLGFLRIDDDDILDAFMVSISGAVVYTAFGATSGDFALADQFSTEVFAFTMGDMTGDLRAEAIALSLDGVEVFSVGIDGTIFRLEDLQPDGIFDYEAVEVEDFNGDEQNDVLFIGNGIEGRQLLMYLGNGDGTLAPSLVSSVAGATDPTGLAVGDFNADGSADFVVVDGDSLLPVYGNDALGFSQLEGIPLDSSTVGALTTADIDLDGIDDIALGYARRSVVSVYLGQATDDFSDPVEISIGHTVERISTGDANADGVPDIVVTSNADDALTVLFSTN